jgi:very-short-patch-repair endonuclease
MQAKEQRTSQAGQKARLSSGVVFLQHLAKGKLRQARELRKKMTPAERALWEQVRRKKLLGVKFRRQQIIDGFVTDFYCHQAALVVEVDGSVHDLQGQKDRDELRRKVFEARGLMELRFRNEEVLGGTDRVVKEIARWVESRSKER